MLRFKEYISEGINDPSIFKAVFLAGGPGSGKSFVVGKSALTSLGFKIINSDSVFEQAMKKASIEMSPENIFSVQLTSLDEIFIDEALKRAITKIDVEGNEIEVLLGGVKYFSNSSNITLIEIIHLNKEQIQRILNDFNMYAYSRNLYKLYKIESYDSLHSMRSKIYGQDAILTLRPLNFNERLKLIVWAKYELLIYKILFNVINLVSKLKRAATV
jgi:shikimate kinase